MFFSINSTGKIAFTLDPLKHFNHMYPLAVLTFANTLDPSLWHLQRGINII
jgi:hypothetical protein